MGIVRRVTNAQVKELRLWLHQGASLKMAAMKAGMDRKMHGSMGTGAVAQRSA